MCVCVCVCVEQVVADMMDHEQSLQVLIEQHPTVTNAMNAVSSETLLQHTIRKSPGANAESLLSANCRFGLVEDTHGHTALMIALKNECKPILRTILNKISSAKFESPHALLQFMRHRVEIATKYPDIFLDFIRNLQLTELDGSGFALLHDSSRMLTEGSEDAAPSDFWADLMIDYDGKIPAARNHSVLASSREPMRNDKTPVDESLVKVEVIACRVPLDGVVGQNREMMEFPGATLTYLVMSAATSLNNYEIFDDNIVLAMLQAHSSCSM